MPHRLNRNAHAPIGAALDQMDVDQVSGHENYKRNRSHSDQSSNIHTRTSTPRNSSAKCGGEHASHCAASDNDADGDISNADAAEPDDESDEDGEGDAFAPSDRAIDENGNQAGHIKGDVSDCRSGLFGKQSHDSSAFKSESKAIKASSTAGDTDDDVYNRVDLISDSGEDEPNVEQVEEKNIIESEEADNLNTAPATYNALEGWEGYELDDGLFLEDVPFFDEQYGRTDSNILGNELELFQPASIFGEHPSSSPPSPSPRRVRFKEPISQLSNDSDMDSDKGDLTVLFSPAANPILPSGGDMDLGGPLLDHDGDDGSSVGSSSGYETDYGDTTDEEDVPASATKRPQSLLRQPSLSSLELETPLPANAKAKRTAGFPGTAAGYRRGPRMGTWIVDSTKPCAVIDSTGENMIIRPAVRPSKPNNMFMSIAHSVTSTANASPTVSQQNLAAAPEDSRIDSNGFSAKASMIEYNDPVLGPGSDLAGASTPSLTGHSQQPSMAHSFTASSVFFPMDAMGDVNSLFEDDYMNDDDEDDDDDDALLNIDDFIDFGDDSSEDENEAAGVDSNLTSPITAESPGLVQLKTPSPDATMASDDLMKHLDKHLVSAFRRGQPFHQPQPRSRYGHLATNSYALKTKKQAATNASIDPQRKRKMSGSLGHRPSFGTPAAKRRMVHHG